MQRLILKDCHTIVSNVTEHSGQEILYQLIIVHFTEDFHTHDLRIHKSISGAEIQYKNINQYFTDDKIIP